MPNKDIKYLLALHSFKKFGSVKIRKLLNYFHDSKTAFQADLYDLTKAKIEEKNAIEFIKKRKDINPDQILEKYEKEQINVITEDDSEYPHLLSEIHNPPSILYYKGNLPKENLSIAIVGTRKFTNYGKIITEKITKSLIQYNFSIISGLALGIDTLAHSTTIINQGYTIAVLGASLATAEIYPRSNKFLADKIIATGGALISEFPIGTEPQKFNFPQRNRIISGLSHGTIVVEAGAKSGALITANFALEQNREVFAIPGSILSNTSSGPNNLIKEGAKPITNLEDILETFNIEKKDSNKQKYEAQTPEEELILTHLSYKSTHINELVRKTKMNTAQISGTLTILEMNGIVKDMGGMQYILM